MARTSKAKAEPVTSTPANLIVLLNDAYHRIVNKDTTTSDYKRLDRPVAARIKYMVGLLEHEGAELALPLTCDYCEALVDNPWHGSEEAPGAENRHVHSCDKCHAEHTAVVKGHREQALDLQACDSMAKMLRDNEWAEHVGAGPVSRDLEAQITRLISDLNDARVKPATHDRATLIQRLREYVTSPHHIDPPSEACNKLIDEVAAAIAVPRVSLDLLTNAYWDFDARRKGYPPYKVPAGQESAAFRDALINAIEGEKGTTEDVQLADKAENYGLPHDIITHKHGWRAAIARAAELEPKSHAPDEDEKGYWQHELAAYDKMHAELTGMIAQGYRFNRDSKLIAALQLLVNQSHSGVTLNKQSGRIPSVRIQWFHHAGQYVKGDVRNALLQLVLNGIVVKQPKNSQSDRTVGQVLGDVRVEQDLERMAAATPDKERIDFLNTACEEYVQVINALTNPHFKQWAGDFIRRWWFNSKTSLGDAAVVLGIDPRDLKMIAGGNNAMIAHTTVPDWFGMLIRVADYAKVEPLLTPEQDDPTKATIEITELRKFEEAADAQVRTMRLLQDLHFDSWATRQLRKAVKDYLFTAMVTKKDVAACLGLKKKQLNVLLNGADLCHPSGEPFSTELLIDTLIKWVDLRYRDLAE